MSRIKVRRKQKQQIEIMREMKNAMK